MEAHFWSQSYQDCWKEYETWKDIAVQSEAKTVRSKYYEEEREDSSEC